MPAGRRAPCPKVVRIQIVLLGVGPQPADGRLAVLNLSREPGVLTESIVDARDGIAAGDQPQGRPAEVLRPGLPRPAVDPDDQRPRAGPGRAVEVELVPLVWAVSEVAVARGPVRQRDSRWLGRGEGGEQQQSGGWHGGSPWC